MSFLYRQEIRSLRDGTLNTFVIGVIINSANVKTFDDIRSRFNNGKRAVWTFTLRDSEEDFINVTVWGSTEFVKILSTTFTIGSIVRRTLITECLNVPQAADITNAVQRYDPDSICSDSFAVPNPETITTVMTVQQITEKLQKKTIMGDERLQFATIVRASITEMNLNGPLKDTLSIRCALCKKIVMDVQDSCMNLNCPSGNGTRTPLNTVKFNIKINLKDDTGYLIGCRLTDDIAERVLGHTVDEFQAMTVEKRSELKWQYLLEKCDVRLHILGPTSGFPRALYKVLSIQSDKEMAQALEQIASLPEY